MFSFMAQTSEPFLQEFSGFYILFSFQGSLFCCCRFLRQLIYFITPVRFCQQLFLFSFSNSSRCLKGRSLFGSFVPYVHSTKLDSVSLRFANNPALSSCFAFTKLLSVSRTRHILPPTSTKVNTFFTKFFELFQMYV